MTLQCGTYSQSKVYWRRSLCGGCDTSIQPWHKFVPGDDFSTTNISSRREVVSLETLRGSNKCSRSFDDGGTFEPEFALGWGLSQAIIAGTFGEQRLPTRSTGAQTMLVTAADTIESSGYDFNDALTVGQMVILSGFSDPQNNSDPAIHGGNNWRYYLVLGISERGVTPSRLTLATAGQGCASNGEEFNPDLAPGSSGGEVSLLVHNWQSSDRLQTVDIQRSINGNAGEMISSLTGAALTDVSLTLTPNAFGTASITMDGVNYDGSTGGLQGFVDDDGVDSDLCDVLFWDTARQNVRVLLAGVPLCIENLTVQASRNSNKRKFSCQDVITPGDFEATFTMTAIVGSGAYLEEFEDALKAQSSETLTIQMWDDDLNRFSFISIPAAKLTSAPMDTDEAPFTYELTYNAETASQGDALVVGGSNYLPPVPVENVVEFCTVAQSVPFATTGSGDDLFYDMNGSGVADSFGAPTGQTFTYSDGLTSHQAAIYDNSAAAWPDVTLDGAGIVSVSFCSLKGANTVSVANNDLPFVDASDMWALETLNISGNPQLSTVNTDTSFQLRNIDATGTALSSSTIENVLGNLIDYGAAPGAVQFAVGTTYSPLATAQHSELTTLGWSITPAP